MWAAWTWVARLFPADSVAAAVMVIALVAATGLALGAVKIRGVSLGIPGVLFTGLIVRHLGASIDLKTVSFVRDFGLILFVYAVGVQVGPGFFATLRKRGLPLNLMAASIVLLGVVSTIAIAKLAHVDIRVAVGMFAGATTNAPALASAQEAIKQVGVSQIGEASRMTGPAFAIAYPFGLVGVIVAMILMRAIFRIKPQVEADELTRSDSGGSPELATMNIELTNENLDGLPLSRIPSLGDSVVVSRIYKEDEGRVMVATPETQVSLGDVLLAVGPSAELDEFRLIVGERTTLDVRKLPSEISTRSFLVTRSEVLGKTVDELDMVRRLGVTITRVVRLDMELTPTADVRLQFGDRVRAVGDPSALDKAATELGNSVHVLNHPRLLPIFVGIMLGVTLGSIPVFLPGMPAPLKLGLATGPMLVAIALARIGRIGPLIWYMPHNASALLKEMGIVLFLVGVGLLAGDHFVETLTHGPGFYWMGLSALITIVPLMTVAVIGRVFFKINYMHICGLLAGSMTSPSLAFTGTMTTSEAPAVAFATVYPLTMLLRVLLAQIIVLIFA